MALDPQLLEILACPEDKGPLSTSTTRTRSTTRGCTVATRASTTSRHAHRRGRDGRRLLKDLSLDTKGIFL